ncbi:MAG TPA: hypothetical protein VL461_13250 [Dictyobacter sp.]|jgi:imidazolonepropionase-like amidohydrolase|nr:hypothetical protein [Dictyobacter sp.]
MQTLIYNANLIFSDSSIENGWVVIENGAIVALGEAATCPTGYVRTIDARSGFVLCGITARIPDMLIH